MKGRTLFLTAFLLGLVVLLIRGHGRLLHSEIWGEDAIFTSEALNLGWASLFKPLAGSLQVAQRLLVLTCTAVLPISKLPGFIARGCMLISAAVFAYFAQPSFRWLIRSDILRVATCATFCTLAPLQEMFGNTPNINWVLFTWMALLLLKSPEVPIRSWELGGVAITLCSIGTFLLLGPLLVWRCIEAWRVPEYRHNRLQLGVILGLFCAVLFVTVAFDVGESADRSKLIAAAPDLMFRFNLQTMLYQPLFGSDAAEAIRGVPALDYGMRCIAFLALLWFWRRAGASRRWFTPLALLMLGMSIWPLLSAAAREPNLIYFTTRPDADFWRGHYGYPNMFLGVLLLTILCGRTHRLIGLAFLMLTICFSAPWFTIARYGPEHLWEQHIGELEHAIATGCASPRIPTFPEPWGFIYEGTTSCKQ